MNTFSDSSQPTNPASPTLLELEARYPARNTLPPQARVTRFAPSPTGFMHIGGLYNALISERLAHQSGGVFFLRIEDTDRKREVGGARELIARSLEHYTIIPDEGISVTGDTIGKYGPYAQSERGELYKVYAQELIRLGKAYPCFCTIETLDAIHKKQELMKIRPGYYGEWATCRKLSTEEAATNVAAGIPHVLRFKSQGNFENKIPFHDIIRGTLNLSENDQDIVLIKSDGLPTYHFAHVVDDHLMRTTHVIRGDEWISSAALHIQLFEALGWTPPSYGHIMPIQKIDAGNKRKLSKRKDPEANVEFYDKEGYPVQSVLEYLLNLANSSFEDWRKANPALPWSEFPLSIERLSHSTGALFDFVKLGNISKEVISRMTAQEVYTHGITWARNHDAALAAEMEKDSRYTTAIFGIERTGLKIRKDISKWSDLRNEIGYFFDSIFETTPLDHTLITIPHDDAKSAIQKMLALGDSSALTKEVWLEKVRAIATELGYADSTKTFKLHPEKYKGTIAHITGVFRVLLAGRTQTPDLYEMMCVMGHERVTKRLSAPL